MKQAFLKDLQSRLLGSVTDSPDVLQHFSTDQSIYQATPTAVVYPQNTADVRKTMHFAAERAAAGKPLPIVARGKGSDQTGGAVGEGLQVVFPAHMNKLLRVDRDTVTVQPGILFSSLQQTLNSHGRFIPQAPVGPEYSTVGGLVASDTGGEKSHKYGTIRRAVRKLKVVLSDGSLIECAPIGPRELSRKKGVLSLEGEIYRKLDSALLDNADLIAKKRLPGVQNSAGYNLWGVRGSRGTFDLAQMFIGSQGTLGLITEVTLSTLAYSARTTLLVGYFDSIAGAGKAAERLVGLGPSSLELVDRALLEFHLAQRPGDLDGLLPAKLPSVILLVEFDNYSQFAQRLRASHAERVLRRNGAKVRASADPVEQVALWKIRRASVASWLDHGPSKALPFIEDAAVPVAKLPKLLEKTYKLLESYELEPAIWGHAGSGNLRIQPRLDLSKRKDVTKLFELAADYRELVLSLGGTLTSAHNDNLLQAAHLTDQYGEEFVELLASVKHIFDPQNILNPSKKTGATEQYVREHLREEYSAGRLHDFRLFT